MHSVKPADSSAAIPDGTEGREAERSVLNRFIGILAARPMGSLGVLAVLGAVLIVGEMHRVIEETAYNATLESAIAYSNMISTTRDYYSSEIVPRAKASGAHPSHEFREIEGGVPLPATLTIELGRNIARQGTSARFRLFSAEPFPWRRDGGPQDEVEATMLEYIVAARADDFVKVEEVGNERYLRYAVPVVMNQSCVDCHNTYPGSPRTDWRVGDVRGVQSVRLAMPTLHLWTQFLDRNAFVFIFAGAIGFFSLLALVLRHLQSAITERAEAEERMKAQHHFLESLLDTVPNPIFYKSTSGEFLGCNKPYADLVGLPKENIVGRDMFDVFPKDRAEIYRDADRQLIADGGIQVYETNLRRFDGRDRDVVLNKAVFRNFDGTTAGIVGVIQDITDRKRTERDIEKAKREAVQANHSKSAFLADMSHDLRTPLNAIIGFADILNNQYFGPIDEKYREYTKGIAISGDVLLSLVNEILDLSSIEVGKKQLSKELLDLEEIVSKCEKIASAHASDARVQFSTRVLNGGRGLYADKRAVEQILLNLLSNGIKFTPPDGKVTLSAVVSEGNALFTVDDTGKGIPPSELAKLTEPFVRGETDPYVTKKGYGLGLAIVKSLVSLHDGEIGINSVVGKGTTVSVMLPADGPH